MTRSFRPHAALILCNVIWALDFPFYKILLPHFASPLAMATSAVAVAALFALVASAFGPWEKVDRRDIPKLLGAGLLTAVLRKLFLMEGIAYTSPVDGAVINTVSPVFVLLLSVVMGLDRLTPRRILGVALGAGGALLVIFLGGARTHEASSLSGNLLVLGCAFSGALYLTWFKQTAVKYRTVTLMRWMYCTGAVLLIPFGASDVVHTHYSTFTHPAMLAYLFLLFIPTFGPNFLQAYGLKRVKPMVSSMYAYVEPVVATAIAVGMGLDRLHWDTAFGAATIFLGVWFVIRSYRDGSAFPAGHPR